MRSLCVEGQLVEIGGKGQVRIARGAGGVAKNERYWFKTSERTVTDGFEEYGGQSSWMGGQMFRAWKVWRKV